MYFDGKFKQKFFIYACLGNKSYYDPTNFVKTLDLQTAIQQDAQEFSKLLLSHIEGILKTSTDSFLCNLIATTFNGTQQFVTSCQHCKYSSCRTQGDNSIYIYGCKLILYFYRLQRTLTTNPKHASCEGLHPCIR